MATPPLHPRVSTGQQSVDRVQDQYARALDPALKKVGALDAFTTARTSPAAMAPDCALLLVAIPGASRRVTLPLRPQLGRIYLVKDAQGDASTRPITITPLSGVIDGFDTHLLDVDSGAKRFVYDGQNWWTV